MNEARIGIYKDDSGNRYELMYLAKGSDSGSRFAVFRMLDNAEDILVVPLEKWRRGEIGADDAVTRLTVDTAFECESGCSFDTEVDEDPEIFTDPPLEESEYADRGSEDVHPTEREILKKYYGFERFREGQEKAIGAIREGRDVLVIMPTGGGKSICYQVPALMGEGLTIVISPLISLMQDQVRSLVENGIPAAYINSSLTEGQISKVLANLSCGKYRLLYIAPERLVSRSLLRVVQEIPITLVAVDEAHCISQWGQDFRPSYLKIPEFIRSFGKRPPICALTATATPKVRSDIISMLDLRDPVDVMTGFDRKNLYFSVLEPPNKTRELVRLLKQYPDMPGIVYCSTRKSVDTVWDHLRLCGFKAARYHAGLSDEERKESQEAFIYDRVWVLVATNAFGMGIDKANVRFVIHYNMPGDLESYYQEAGRAGRDGERADCHLLFSRGDIQTQHYFIENMGENAQLEESELLQVQKNARQRLQYMIRYAKTQDCLRYTILKYFGEEAPKHCGFCLRCRVPVEQLDCTAESKQVLSCISQTNERFGRGMIIDILRGADTERIRTNRFNTLLCYGTLQHLSSMLLGRVLERMLELEVLCLTDVTSRNGDVYQILKSGKNAGKLLNGELEIKVPRPIEKVTGRKKKADASEPLSGDQQIMFDDMRALRAEIASRRGIPVYYVFSDQTLRDICASKPITLDELSRIKGIGEAKLRSYGKEIIDLVRRHTLQ